MKLTDEDLGEAYEHFHLVGDDHSNGVLDNVFDHIRALEAEVQRLKDDLRVFQTINMKEALAERDSAIRERDEALAELEHAQHVHRVLAQDSIELENERDEARQERDHWIGEHAKLEAKLAAAERVVDAARTFLDSFPRHYHGFPGKLEWFEIHGLKQKLEAFDAIKDGGGS
jgi:chromosome segregation ATPase